MNIRFEEITKDNWEECIELRVDESQESFVAENSYSLLQAHYSNGLYPLAIYDDEIMVGFLMYEYDEVDDDMGMCRLMIDKKYQKRGYGRAAIVMLIELMKQKFGDKPMYTSFESENRVAMKLYKSLGFEDTGRLLDEEILLKLRK